MSQLPTELVERLRTRQVVLVTGPGCASTDSGAWEALGRRLCDRVDDAGTRDVVAAELAAGRTGPALALLRDLVPDETFVSAFEAASPAGRTALAGLNTVARIPWRGVITTATDDLWETALGAEGRTPPTVLLPGQTVDLDTWRGQFLVHALGRASVPGTLCVSPRDIRAKIGCTPTGRFLAEAFRRWTFVFVGFRGDDPELDLLAGSLLGGFESASPHYLLCSGMSAARGRLLAATHALVPISLPGDLDEALVELGATWDSVAPTSRPAAHDVAGWIEVWAHDPTDPDARAAVDHAAGRLRSENKWQELVELLVQRAELVHEHDEQVASLREVALLFDQHLGAPAQAYMAISAAWKLLPADSVLLNEAKRLARKAGKWDEFVQEFGAVVQELAPSESSGHVLDLGRIHAGEGRQDEAIATFERALAADPDSGEAIAALEGLYRDAQRWRDLARILGERARRTSDPVEARRVQQSRAEMVIERLQDAGATIAILEGQVAADPGSRAALRLLVKIYEGEKRTGDVLRTLERLIPLSVTDDERRPLLTSIGEGYRTRPDGNEKALDAFARAFAMGERKSEALEFLARIYEERGQGRLHAEVLDRWAEVAGDGRQRAEILVRAAKAFEGMGDAAAGEERYARALQQDAENDAARVALSTFSRAKGDFLRAATLAAQSAGGTHNPAEKARLLFEAGTMHEDGLHDEIRASELYQAALVADPGHTDAALRLAATLERKQDWAALEPLLDSIARTTKATAELHARIAACARRLGKNDQAIRSFEAARALAPDWLPALRGLAELQFLAAAWTEARTLLKTLRRVGEGTLSQAERIELYVRLARCESELGEHESARGWFEDAAALDPPTDEKAGLWDQIGDLCRGPCRRLPDAILAYQQALTLQPGRHQTLHKILDVYTEHKKWTGAVETLGKLAALESSPAARAKVRYTAGVILRDESKNPEEAVAMFSAALDDDPQIPKAFEAVERLLLAADDSRGLARAYRKMLKRLPQEGQIELRARLWHALGTVLQDKLGDADAAAIAFEVASSLQPGNAERAERLAGIYVNLGAEAVDKAIARHQALINRQPERAENYRTLAELFGKKQAYDRMWCVAATYSYLRGSDETLTKFHQRHRMVDVPIATGKLTPELWQRIAHPQEDASIGAIFTLLAPTLSLQTAQPHQAMGVRRVDRVDLAREDWFPAVALRYVSATLDVPQPDVFVHDAASHSVAIWNLHERSSLAPAFAIAAGFEQCTPWEVVFDLAKRAAFLRPERFPRVALSAAAEIDLAVRAALSLAGRSPGPSAHNGTLEQTVKRLGDSVPRALVAQLTLALARFPACRGETIDVPGWIAAADLTASRAAFVLSGDLPSAARVLASEPAGLTTLPLAERMGDLLAFSVSEDYFAARRALGLRAV